jgi:hypothetical protein
MKALLSMVIFGLPGLLLLQSCSAQTGRQPIPHEIWKEIILPKDWSIKVPDSLEFSVIKSDPTGAWGIVYTADGKPSFKIYGNIWLLQ